MRSHMLFIASATVLATLSAGGLAAADDSPTPRASEPGGITPPMNQGDVGTPSTTTTTMTPSGPTVPATPSTSTTTTQSDTMDAPTTTTSTTTTTAADTEALPPVTMPAPRESVTVSETRRPNKAILITGAALLASTYVTTAAVVGANGPVSDHDLYIPVVGPWINLADRSCVGECPDETRDKWLIAGSGVLQGVGAIMTLTSFFVPEKVPTARIQAGPVKMQVTPTAGAGAGGLGAVGTF